MFAGNHHDRYEHPIDQRTAFHEIHDKQYMPSSIAASQCWLAQLATLDMKVFKAAGSADEIIAAFIRINLKTWRMAVLKCPYLLMCLNDWR